jgi:hypothetical protein
MVVLNEAAKSGKSQVKSVEEFMSGRGRVQG